ncbi:MAG: thioesterase family protein [Caulobacteraceae bacterium]|nr:thioesterase family protein [Caulobacteraceae bacterium]
MLRLFDLEAQGAGQFRIAGMEGESRRLFGGQLVAQALAAATRTVRDERRVHSLHAYFIRAGVTTSPLEFAVAEDADGGSLSFRRVLVSQDERPLLSLSASFQPLLEGFLHQVAAPAVPPPESLEDDYVRAARLDSLPAAAKALINRASPFRFRSTDLERRYDIADRAAPQEYWLRIAAPLPDPSQAFQRIVFAYASDMMLLGAALVPHGLRWFSGGARIASIDHALWIHGDVRMDDWLLIQHDAPWSGDGRGLNRGRIFDRTGRLVATVMQEGSMRPAPGPTERPAKPSAQE